MSSRVFAPIAEYRLQDRPLWARMAHDDDVRDWLADSGGAWHPTVRIGDRDGGWVASVWREDGGSVLLPFDPSEAIWNYWSETYQSVGNVGRARRAEALGGRLFYSLRPVIPRSLQIAMRRGFSRLQVRAPFPAWPTETALHDLFMLIFGLVADVSGEPVPWLSPWPRGHDWALVLTHDVETEAGYRSIDLLCDVERGLGYRSSWNFVPKRYHVEDAVVEELQREGFEVGVHGLYHDGRDLQSRSVLERRLPEMQAHADRWRAVGFRSPGTNRVWDLMPLLGFDYDSSYPDTDLFGPKPGGCCTWLPFFNDDLVELPITLPQDHTLFAILGHKDGSVWHQKAAYLRKQGGMALLITHPDYASKIVVEAYTAFLASLRDDSTVWRALPCEVSAWWRRRAASEVVRAGHRWKIVGPAADEARIEFADPPGLRSDS